jgi:probable RNA-binding protein EIF1AD
MGGSKRNHVIKSALQEYAEPPGEDEHICKALGSRGSNKIDVELPDGHTALVILPARFHKKIWIRKGSFVIVKAVRDEEEEGERFFTGEIVRVLLKDDVKYLKTLKKDGKDVWPSRFSTPEDVSTMFQELEVDSETDSDSASSDEDELPPHLQRVQNRRIIQYLDDDDDDDD